MSNKSPDGLERIEVSISLPARLVGEIDLEFFNDSTGKPEYGARSRLIARLLSNWLQERRKLVEV